MRAINPESQEDAMGISNVQKKDEEKNNLGKVLHSSQNLCVHHTITNTDNIIHQKVTFNILYTFFNVFITNFIQSLLNNSQ